MLSRVDILGEELKSEWLTFRPDLGGIEGVEPTIFGVNWVLFDLNAELNDGVKGLLFVSLMGFSFGILLFGWTR